MNHDSTDMLSRNNEEPGTARQSILDGSLSSVSSAGESPLRMLRVSGLIKQCQRGIGAYRRGEPSNEVYGLELLHRALVQGDQNARAGVQHCLSELVRGWLYAHPHGEAALCWQSEEHYMALTFERFWQATVQHQVAFRTLSGALAYLRASLNGALLETLRTSSRPREVSLPKPDEAGEPHVEDRANSNRFWEVLQSMLPSEREQRLAYLLYHCGLLPREIVQRCPQEWNDVQEIYRLRHIIIERLLRNANQLHRRLNDGEQR